jgi:hypothetical protein
VREIYLLNALFLPPMSKIKSQIRSNMVVATKFWIALAPFLVFVKAVPTPQNDPYLGICLQWVAISKRWKWKLQVAQYLKAINEDTTMEQAILDAVWAACCINCEVEG